MRSRLSLVIFLAVLILATGGYYLGWLERGRSGPADLRLVSGQVIDARGPVAGARVRVKGRADSALTDEAGRFTLLRPPAGTFTVTASKQGYFIAGVPGDSQPLVIQLAPLPDSDNERYAWVDPTPAAGSEHNCGNCHDEMYQEWKSSGHSRAATGKNFRNLYEGTDWHGRPGRGWSLIGDYPNGAGVCTSCHAPTVPFEDEAFYDLRKARGVAAQGVHCDYCHKIEEASTEKVGLTHGRFAHKLLRPSHGQLFFGPLDDVDRGEDVFSPLQRDSRICASCHEGVVFGVPVYTTYTEWLASPARAEGKQCQSCHMKPSGRTNIAPGSGGIERDPGMLSSHSFLPGGLEAMLKSCLKVDVQTALAADGVRVTVDVTADNVGHRVPTGFIDRHLLLVVEARDENGQLLKAKSGPLLPSAAGSLAGRAGRLFAKLLTDHDGSGPIPFWRSAAEPIDTRLVPRQVVPSEFMFPSNASQVEVRLVYRRFWEETAKSKDWPDDEVSVYHRSLPRSAWTK
jgi:nitrate/TMAO reductase-like tetraheme cytochrome c subunit